MAKTALPFYRKNQNMANLDSERPKSIESFRGIVRSAVEEIEKRMTDVEKLFYGGRRCEDALRDVVPVIRRIMRVFGISSFQAAWQVNEILTKLKDPEGRGKVDEIDLRAFTDMHTRIVDFVPARLQPLINDIMKVLQNLKKYCLSFCPKYRDAYLETVSHYDLKINEFSNAICMQVDNILKMINAYKGQGVLAKHLGIHTNDVARRCDCASMPVLLIFPESCANIRNACAAALKWLQEEEMYAGYIKIDIAELERKKEYQVKVVREAQNNVSHVEHKLKTTRRDTHESTLIMQKSDAREELVVQEVVRLEKEISDAQYTLDYQEHVRESHRRRASAEMTSEIHERFESIISEILSLRDKLSGLKRQLDSAKIKRDRVLERKSRVEKLTKQLSDLETELKTSHEQRHLEEKELKRISVCLEHLKRIYLYKTSPDAMKKIFYQMPVETRNARLHRTKPKPGQS